MNERIHFFIKLHLLHFILERIDVGCVWAICWRRDTLLYWPVVLLSHFGSGCWGPKPCRWISLRYIVSYWVQLTQTVCAPGYIIVYVHLLPLFFRLFTQVQFLIDGSVKGQYVTFLLMCPHVQIEFLKFISCDNQALVGCIPIPSVAVHKNWSVIS